jgi:hypothetical protein
MNLPEADYPIFKEFASMMPNSENATKLACQFLRSKPHLRKFHAIYMGIESAETIVHEGPPPVQFPPKLIMKRRLTSKDVEEVTNDLLELAKRTTIKVERLGRWKHGVCRNLGNGMFEVAISDSYVNRINPHHQHNCKQGSLFASLHLADTLFHELGHAYWKFKEWKRGTNRTVESFIGHDHFNEIGFSVTYLWGGILSFHEGQNEEEDLQLLRYGLKLVQFDQRMFKVYEYLGYGVFLKGAACCTSTYFVPLSWVQRVYTNEFWDLVNMLGEGHLECPKILGMTERNPDFEEWQKGEWPWKCGQAGIPGHAQAHYDPGIMRVGLLPFRADNEIDVGESDDEEDPIGGTDAEDQAESDIENLEEGSVRPKASEGESTEDVERGRKRRRLR